MYCITQLQNCDIENINIEIVSLRNFGGGHVDLRQRKANYVSRVNFGSSGIFSYSRSPPDSGRITNGVCTSGRVTMSTSINIKALHFRFLKNDVDVDMVT